MSKSTRASLVAGLVVVAVLAGAGAVYAQGEGPGPRVDGGPWGHMPGWGMGRGGGLLSEYSDVMHAAIADVLGISPSAFEQAIEDGETLYSLAQEYDVDFQQLREVMAEARSEAIEQALDDEAITEEQAEWLQFGPMGPLSGDRPWGNCDGRGPHGMSFGRRGGWRP